MDIESFIIHIKEKDIYKDISEDFEKRFNTPNYEVDRPLPIWKNQKAVRSMKDKSGEQVMKKIGWIMSRNLQLFKWQWWWM